MTRINTNISSLLAQQSLATSNANLQSALTQLSTGKKINSGADNPAGLIASQELAGDIANTNQAVSNSQMASSMISTADSSLAQVSSLLTTIQGLVNQAASTGNMSATAIAANQEVVDSSLDAISRIASTTSFQGQNLLDGSLAFKTTPSTNFATNASSLQVSQANLGTSGQLGVDVNVATAATGALLKTTIPAVGAAAAPAAGTTQVFANASTTGTGSITITAPTTGTQYNGVHLLLETDANVAADDPQASYNASAKEIIVKVNDTTATKQDDIATAISNFTPFTAVASDTLAGKTPGTDIVDPTAGGDFGLVGGAGLTLDALTTVAGKAANSMQGGASQGGGLASAVQMQITGSNGSQVFSFAAGSLASTMAATINQSSDQTGVFASISAVNTLVLTSNDTTKPNSTAGYGSAAQVQVTMLNGTTLPGAIQDVNNNASTDSTGANATGTINGVAAVGNGNTLSVDNSNLAMSMTVTPNTAADTDIDFTITGGGAVFQIGPTVGSNQQAHLGIQSMNTTSLGGAEGTLYDLYSNGSAALATDPTTAAQIVNDAVNQVTSLRGQLGAFQSATLDSNISSLTSAVTNLTSAKSTISDADFASESAALTQAQVLVQSGTAVLSIANHEPQSVLALLQGNA